MNIQKIESGKEIWKSIKRWEPSNELEHRVELFSKLHKNRIFGIKKKSKIRFEINFKFSPDMTTTTKNIIKDALFPIWRVVMIGKGQEGCPIHYLLIETIIYIFRVAIAQGFIYPVTKKEVIIVSEDHRIKKDCAFFENKKVFIDTVHFKKPTLLFCNFMPVYVIRKKASFIIDIDPNETIQELKIKILLYLPDLMVIDPVDQILSFKGTPLIDQTLAYHQIAPLSTIDLEYKKAFKVV